MYVKGTGVFVEFVVLLLAVIVVNIEILLTSTTSVLKRGTVYIRMGQNMHVLT